MNQYESMFAALDADMAVKNVDDLVKLCVAAGYPGELLACQNAAGRDGMPSDARGLAWLQARAATRTGAKTPATGGQKAAVGGISFGLLAVGGGILYLVLSGK